MFKSFNNENSSSQICYNFQDENTSLSEPDDWSDSEEGDLKVKIPKIIMQTWKDHDIPDKWKGSPQSIKEMMPDWEYVLMTDEDNREFVKKYFPDFLKYYDRFPHNIQRADAIRYMWLYINGGVYMDLDFEVLYPLDDLFYNDVEAYLVSSSNVGSYITNSFMASKPGCKLWLEAIEAMKQPDRWYYQGKHITVMNTTGPIMLTHVVKKSRTVYGMLPGKLLLPCSVCNIFCRADNAYLKQLEGSSWITYDTKVYNFFMCNWKPLLVAIGLIFLVIFMALLLCWLEWV